MSGAMSIARMLLVILVTSSCASLWPFGGGKSGAPEAAEKPIAAPESKNIDHTSSTPDSNVAVIATPVRDDEISLKQARLMARMDEIENELKRQREKVRLLEQGLLTGIVPDDLKTGGGNKKNQKSGNHAAGKLPVEDLFALESSSDGFTGPNLDGVDVNPDKKNRSSDTGSASVLTTRMQIAKEHYQASRFGLAIAELAGMSREFGDKAGDGAVRLWLGKSYLGLKEYATARGEFEAYLKGWPSGEGVSSARLELARVYVGLGLKERARVELRRVIKDFDGQEVSEMASQELKNLQGNL